VENFPGNGLLLVEKWQRFGDYFVKSFSCIYGKFSLRTVEMKTPKTDAGIYHLFFHSFKRSNEQKGPINF